MPIKGLQRQLNEAGKIKIGMKGKETESEGGKKFRMPVRLDHFIITTTEKDESNDFIQDEILMDNLKRTPESGALINKDGNLIGIPIRLLYEDTDLNFPTRYASYNGGKLSCQGDGEKACDRVSDFKKEKPCPCQRQNPDYDGKDKCKPNGSLTCIIDNAGLFGQAHKFRTTSINSVNGILGGIELIKTATKGRIAGLPLMLVVNNKTTAIPGSGQPTTVQVVSVCYRGDMASLRREAIEMMRQEHQYLLDMESIESDARAAGAGEVIEPDEETDFVEEFFPDSVDADIVVQGQDDAIGNDPSAGNNPSAGQDDNQQVLNQQDTDLIFKIKEEKDPDKAVAIAKRLSKPGVIRFLRMNTIPMKDGENKPYYVELACEFRANQRKIEEAEKPEEETNNQDQQKESELLTIPHPFPHPFYVELCAIAQKNGQRGVVEAMRSYFVGTPINGTLETNDLLEKAKQLLENEMEKNAATSEKQTSSEQAEVTMAERQQWDDGGPVERAQLVQLIELKTKFKITDEAWLRNVMFFKDQSGKEITTARDLTKKQAEYFIERLEAEGPDIIPF